MSGRGPATCRFTWLLSGALLACADLPAVPSNTCGNGVIEEEKGEDCDTFPLPLYPNSTCRGKDEPGACHLECSVDSRGTGGVCPPGWGCSTSGLCRAPTGDFNAPRSHPIGPVAGLLTGDFDGDGRSDVVTRKPTDRLDRSQLALHFFDETGALLETRAFPKFVSSPALHELSHDGRADLIFNDFRIGLLLGREDRKLVPETFSSYRVPDTLVRMVGVYDGFVSATSNLVVFANFEGQPGFSVPDTQSSTLRSLGQLPDAIEARSDPIVGDVIEGADSPCDEVIVAAPGASSFRLLDVCAPKTSEGMVLWRDSAQQTAIELVPPALLEGPALIADLNADGHLDVMVGSAGQAYVAYGDGAGLASAVPFTLDYLDNMAPKQKRAMPLAAGDFTGDGWADYVYPDQFVVTFPRRAAGPPRYEVGFANLDAPWTVAKIADVNGNGKNDVITASSQSLGVSVHSGTGDSYLWPTTLPTLQPVLLLNVADIDSDLTNDVAFVEAPPPGEERASLSIAFGNVGRPPSEPLLVARLQAPEQLCSYRIAARGNLVVANSYSEPYSAGAITLLDGTTDRIPFAPYTLVSFSDDRDLRDHPAQHVLGGSFRGPDHRDVIALDSETDFSVMPPEEHYQFWLLADLAAAQSTPSRLRDGLLDPSIRPVEGPIGTETLHIASCSVDLDGDQRDEALSAMPNAEGTCSILSFGIAAESTPRLVTRGTITLDAPCKSPLLAGFDLDADGAPDLLVRTGDDAGERTLRVLWNDGKGAFSADHSSVISAPDEAPEDFTSLPATTVRAPSLVYVTSRAVLQTSWSVERRSFDAPRTLATLEAGRAVTSGDINGDGAVDLAVGDGSKLLLMLAELEGP